VVEGRQEVHGQEVDAESSHRQQMRQEQVRQV
jgi:hypothetical protein